MDACPFCKKSVSVYRSEGVNWFSKLMIIPGYKVACRNELCRVQPSTGVYEERVNAIEAWNYTPTQDKGMPY